MSYYVKLAAATTVITWTLLLAFGMLAHDSMISTFLGAAGYATWLWWRKG